MGIFNGWVIASDIDGTLLPNGTMCPSDETLNAIQNWRKEGGKFVLASGRYLGSTLKVHRNIALDTPMIYNNGACIYLPESNDFLSLKTLGTEITSVIDDLVDTVPYCGLCPRTSSLVVLGNGKGSLKRWNSSTNWLPSSPSQAVFRKR